MSIRKRNEAGLSHIPEDRHKHGLVLDYSLENNLVLKRYFIRNLSETVSCNSARSANTPTS